jgi:putative nucleotidyltransferase with HDIG domain
MMMLPPASPEPVNQNSTSPASQSHEAILRRIRDIPSLPEVVNRILTLLGQSETPASQIASLIAYDPGLTSKVLRMVNSAAYGFQRQISSIQHGIMILGFNTVRGLVLSASIFKLFEGRTHPDGLDHHKFWEHSLTTAVIARYLAKSLRVPDVDEAFSAAMLHDIGKVVLDVHLPAYRDVLQAAKKLKVPQHGPTFRVLEERLLGITHDGIGALLAAKWKLPVAITEVIQFHHQPDLAQSCPQLVHVVSLANEMANLLKAEATHGVFNPGHFSSETLEFFRLDEAALENLYRDAQAEVSDADELMDAISA